MIAHDLQSIADWIAGNAAHGRHIHAATAAQLAIVLLDLARQAEMLEMLPISLREADIVELKS